MTCQFAGLVETALPASCSMQWHGHHSVSCGEDLRMVLTHLPGQRNSQRGAPPELEAMDDASESALVRAEGSCLRDVEQRLPFAQRAPGAT
jgi:hypothetical protein